MMKRQKLPPSSAVKSKRKRVGYYSGAVSEEVLEYLEEDEDDGVGDFKAPEVKLANTVQDRMALLDVPGVEEVGYMDFSKLQLKPDHAARPCWVCPNGSIFLEAFSTLYQQAYDFLVAIAEPVSRPESIHEYKLTPYSLYAAVSVSLETESIITVLERLSKVYVPPTIKEFIRRCTATYGKAKLVLKKNDFYVESQHPDVLKKLLENEIISKARVQKENTEGSGAAGEFIISETEKEDVANLEYLKLVNDEDEDEEVRKEMVEHVKKACVDMDYPLMEEYDFRNDTSIPNLKMDLKPTTRIRVYQEKSLSKMFGNGRARSGIIVLPCGAGKTLTGVTGASTIKKSCLCLCTSAVSVEQWAAQFRMWTNIDSKHIARFTSVVKDEIHPDCGVLVTTYTMISFGGKRSAESEKVMKIIEGREWGTLLLDEVHVVPAKMFRKVISSVAAHCKLGLTATLVREDDLIGDLNFLIGPKLYEANWMDLTQQGYLANVSCREVWCPMTPEFYREYLREKNARKRSLLYVMNPNKFKATELLIRQHERKGDKILIFSDDVFALKKYATILHKPYIYGGTGEVERMRILHQFRVNPTMNVICISKVGDTSIDLPEANVIVQEMYYSNKRQQYLVDQGYTFKVETDFLDDDEFDGGYFNSREAQLQLLEDIKLADLIGEDQAENMAVEDRESIIGLNAAGNKAKRKSGTMGALSGAGDSVYMEYSTAAKQRSTLFKNRLARR